MRHGFQHPGFTGFTDFPGFHRFTVNLSESFYITVIIIYSIPQNFKSQNYFFITRTPPLVQELLELLELHQHLELHMWNL
jgi:hypothetical protein